MQQLIFFVTDHKSIPSLSTRSPNFQAVHLVLLCTLLRTPRAALNIKKATKIVHSPHLTAPSSHPAGLLEWSADSQYLATRNDNMPTAVWVWSMPSLELVAVLLQKDPVKAAMWDPSEPRLAIVTGTAKVFLWTPVGASCIHVPLADFHAIGLQWNPNGTSFVLMDKDLFCTAFIGPTPRDDGG
jgi:hypothetical protein